MLQKRTYKNWREICEVMSWKTTRGNYMKARMKEFESLCKSHKEGNKIVIDELYGVAKQTTTGKGNTIDYVRIIQLFVMDKLACDEEKGSCRIALSKSRLLKELNIVNLNYNECMKHPYKFSKSEELMIESVIEYRDSTKKMLTSNLEKALNNLQKSRLVTWYKGYNIVVGNIDSMEWSKSVQKDFEGIVKHDASLEVKTSEVHIELDDKEIDLMRDCERNILVEMGFSGIGNDNLGKVYNAGKLQEFYHKVCELFKTQSTHNSIISYYPTYIIRFNKELMIEGKDTLREYLIDKLSKQEQITELNEGIKNRILEGAKNRKFKNSEGKYEYRKTDIFIEDIKKINEMTISSCAEYIINRVLNTDLSYDIQNQELLEELMRL